MAATIYVALACVLATVQAAYEPRALFETMIISDDHLQDAFDGMDVKTDKKITKEDLDILFYHKEAEFAKEKFIQLTNKDSNKDIIKSELDAFLKKRPVTNAVFECTYVHSESLREICFRDQILVYTALVLDDTSMGTFFNTIEDQKDADEVIKIDEVKKLISYNPKFVEAEALIFMQELANGDDKITKEEFMSYISEEELLDDFRTCRTDLKGCTATYDYSCLVKELLEHTMYKLTELDIALTFHSFDGDCDKDIDLDDLKKITGCTDDISGKFMTLMDHSGDKKITFGEFRNYINSHMVRLHLEEECALKIVDQNEEVECFKKQILIRVKENHTPILLRLLDLDVLFMFEELDTNNDGKITKNTKIIAEMDGIDKNGIVTLEEYNAFMDYPNMVFALGDCYGEPKGDTRLNCLLEEMNWMLDNMLPMDKVKDFFQHYDKDNSGHLVRAEIEAAGVTGEDVDNFLKEIGMGDMEVVHHEFYWYVRQQELSKMFKGCAGRPDLHAKLVIYLADYVTEYDLFVLFDELDTDDDWELECSDFGADAAAFKAILERMDGPDKDETVNFVEYWVHINTPRGNARKKYLDEKCAKENKLQKDEITCYKKELKNLPA